MRRQVLALISILALVLSTLPHPALAQEGPQLALMIGDNYFEPASTAVASGTSVIWTNMGAEFHTVTSFDGLFDSGVLFNRDSFSWTASEPGEYWYFCQLHDGQEGVITVAAQMGAEPVAPGPEGASAEPTALTPENVSAAPAPPAPTPLPPTPTTIPATATIAPPTATSRPSAPMNAAVSMQGFSFQPASVTVAIGGSVTWTNQDSAPHNATGEGILTGNLNRGQSAIATFNRTGTFAYRCTIHPSMTGQVIVM